MDNIQQPQGEEERRRQEEAEALRVSLAIAAYVDAGIRRDRDAVLYGSRHPQAYEHNGSAYGVASPQTYSDTPKDKK